MAPGRLGAASDRREASWSAPVCGRLGAAPAETFSGLSGLGDLMVTCFFKLSRNRGFGERLGRGEKIDPVLARAVSIAEGYPTAKSAHAHSQPARTSALRSAVITRVTDTGWPDWGHGWPFIRTQN